MTQEWKAIFRVGIAALVSALFVISLASVLRPAQAAPRALPDIPECGSSERDDLVIGYLVCAVNHVHDQQVDLDRRLDLVEGLQGPYRESLWTFMGDRGEFDERQRLNFQDPRRQLQTRYQIELAICRWAIPANPKVSCPPANPLATP